MDGTLIYPGTTNAPVGSIRYEIIRDGIEDYDYLVLLRNALNESRVPPVDRVRAAELLAVPSELSVAPNNYATNSGILQDIRQEISGILERSAHSVTLVDFSPVPGDMMKAVFNTKGAANIYSLLAITNLLDGTWTNVAHSDDGENAFIVTNLGYSTVDATGTNIVIYVQSNDASKFFKIIGME
jgi:hypothetical protein